MTSQNNYITLLWNLNKVSNIDFDKTESTFIQSIPILNLYLIKHIFECPYCNSTDLKIIKSKTKRIKTILRNHSYGEINFHYRVYKCSCCGKYIQENIEALKTHKERSMPLDIEILYALKDYSYTYQKISEFYHISKTAVLDMFDRYVDCKRHEMPVCLSVDEIYARKLTRTKYCCVLYDPMNDKIVDCLDSRRISSLDEYFYHIPLKEREMVNFYTSDLNETYKTVHDRFFKDSIYAVDSFHVVKNLSDLFNKIRIRVMKEYEDQKDYSNSYYWMLKKFYKLLFISEDKIEDKEYEFKKFNMVLDKYGLIYYMLKTSDELLEAYELMKEYKNFNDLYTYDEAPEKLDELIDLFVNAKSKEMKKFGSLLINWRKEIINSFIRINGWRLSNGKLERANRAIKLMFSNAYGYSNFPRTRNRIMYSYNKDEPIFNNKKRFSNKRIMKSRGKYKTTL